VARASAQIIQDGSAIVFMGKKRPPSRRRPAKRFRDVCDTARAQIPPAKHALAPGIRTTLREASPNQP
jgi:hypothetical protein